MNDCAYAIIGAIALFSCTVAILVHGFPIARVCGNSMIPTFKDGDIILSTRFFHGYKIGEVYIFSPPDTKDPKKLVIKRLTKIMDTYLSPNEYLYFMGDNRADSNDSRNYGVVHSDKVVAKVLTKGGKNSEKTNTCIK